MDGYYSKSTARWSCSLFGRRHVEACGGDGLAVTKRGTAIMPRSCYNLIDAEMSKLSRTTFKISFQIGPHLLHRFKRSKPHNFVSVLIGAWLFATLA
jgi:hypothetical protein